MYRFFETAIRAIDISEKYQQKEYSADGTVFVFQLIVYPISFPLLYAHMYCEQFLKGMPGQNSLITYPD